MTLYSVLYCALRPIICSCGIVGNILTLVVLLRINDSSTALQYIKSLAVADIFTLTINSVYIPFILCQLFWPDEYLSWNIKSFSILQLALPFEKISKCIVVAIVLDRVIAVTRPFHYKTICTPFRTTIAIVVIFTSITTTALITIIDTFMNGFETEGNHTIEPSSESEAAHFLNYMLSTKWLPIYIFINRVIFDLLPIPIAITGNVVIIIGLKKDSTVKSKSGDQRKYQERQLTKLLLFVSFMFLMLCAPHDLLVFVTIVNGPYNAQISFSVYEILRTLTLANSSVNFVIYALMNKRYRQGYMSILQCCRVGT